MNDDNGNSPVELLYIYVYIYVYVYIYIQRANILWIFGIFLVLCITCFQILKAEEMGTSLFKVYHDQVWYNTGCKVTILPKCTPQMFLLDVLKMDSLGLTTLWIQQAQSTPTVLREKMKASSQRGISNAVKMMNSLKDNSKILSYLSRNIDNTYRYTSQQAGIQYGRSCSMVSW